MAELLTNLTEQQKDYAIFLPAISSFYVMHVSKQRFENFIDPARIPSHFVNGLESVNWLAPEGMYQYEFSLYSAGHANIDMSKEVPSEDMIRNRNRNTSFVMGDSGGFQIAKGIWKADWKDPNCPKASTKRKEVLTWLDANFDYGIILDIPAWVRHNKKIHKDIGVSTYEEAVIATEINNEYFIRNRNGDCKYLNVMHGETHSDADDWYERMKKYCDPKQYSTHFDGWAMGGQNMCDIHIILKRLVTMMRDGLLEEGVHDWMHFLGTSKIEWAVLLTDIQRAVRKHYNKNFTISYDAASPFLSTINANVYYELDMQNRKKWLYRSGTGIDDTSLSNDTTPYGQAFINHWNEKKFKGVRVLDKFLESPVTQGLTVKDICVDSEGRRNKVEKLAHEERLEALGGKSRIIDKRSWDTFSYFLLMAHNVWAHIHATQEANRLYDEGVVPSMLIYEKHERIAFKDIIDEIISCADSDKAFKLIDEHSRFWTSIIGSRGMTGKRATNALTQFDNLFKEI